MVTIFHEDRWRITVFSTLYLDYGLEIVDMGQVATGDPTEPDDGQVEPITYKEGYQPFCNPHCLSSESYGFKTPDEYEGEFDDCPELIEWDDDDWKQCLQDEADVFIEAYQLEEG
jgi:hypothetical protein